jgi:hypothetical protein
MCALADQQSRDELVRRIGEDEVGRVKADGVPDTKLLHARLVYVQKRDGDYYCLNQRVKAIETRG